MIMKIIINAIFDMYNNYWNFKGKTNRRYYLIGIIFIYTLFTLGLIISKYNMTNLYIALVGILICAVAIIPYFSLVSRRIKGLGKSQIYFAMCFIPPTSIFMFIYLLIAKDNT